MGLERVLIELGYTQQQATSLAKDEYFHHKRKTREELENLFSGIAEVYGCDLG